MSINNKRKIAVLIPCKDEELTIGKVVKDFEKQLPNADIYVFDNNSIDSTSKVAIKSGAIVVKSSLPGKGNVIKHMFATVNADVYIMADGDDTYPADEVNKLIDTFDNFGADMVVGTRLVSFDKKAFRRMHKFGNKLISTIISKLFKRKINDVLSGYRVFSKTLVDNLYLRSDGFEIETEITLQTIIKNFNIIEIPVPYKERPSGSVSKLNTYKDGMLIFNTIAMIFRDYKPLTFFSILGAITLVLAILAGVPPILDYIKFQYVYHVPLAVLSASLSVLTALLFGIGLILNTITRFHFETNHILKNLLKKRL